MTTGNPLEQYELTPEGRRRIGWLAAAVALILAVAAGGWGWSAQRRAGTAEQALAAVAAERDAATAAAGQRQEMLAQAEAAAKAGDARVVELEQQIQALDSLLQGANADVTRLRSELAARDAAPTVAVEANDGSGAVTGSLGTTETATLAPVEPPAPAAPGAEPETPALAAVEPAAAPAAPEIEPETLAIVFDVNSSYLPASLDGRLRELAAKLEPGRAYEVALVGSRRQWRRRGQVGRGSPALQSLDGRAPGQPGGRVPGEQCQGGQADHPPGLRLERPIAPGPGRGPPALGLAQAGGTGRGRRCSSMATKVKCAPVT